ncbi:hypothetical protein [Spirosoma aerophilum]
MEKTSTSSPFIDRLVTLGLLLLILGYQVRLDARLSQLEATTK